MIQIVASIKNIVLPKFRYIGEWPLVHIAYLVRKKKRKEEKIDVICIHLLRAKSKKTKACSSLMRFHVLTRCFEVFLNAFSSTRLFKLISGKTWQNMVSYIVFLIRFRYTTHQIRHNHFIFV